MNLRVVLIVMPGRSKVQRGLGVFVDISLPNKGKYRSFDDTLPELQNLWPKAGDRLMIALRVDDRDGSGAN